MVITLGYLLAYYMPLSRTLAQRLVNQQKLADNVRLRQAETSADSQKIASLQIEEKSLSLELERSRRVSARLVTRRADCTADMLSTTAPAALLSQSLALFARHGLECLDSLPITESKKAPAASHEVLKSVAELLGQPNGEIAARREVQLTLRGSFSDMRKAMGEMSDTLACVYIVSLEMQAAAELSGTHLWIIRFLV